jgi:rhodanese-related sulfurtransferase
MFLYLYPELSGISANLSGKNFAMKCCISSFARKLVSSVSILFILILAAGGQNTSDSVINIVDIEEFIIQMKLHENPVLLDVRSWMEFKKGRIPQAILADNNRILSAITDTFNLDKPLFVYCAENFRGKAAGRFLADKGFKNIYILEVGFNGWKAAGKEIDKTRPKKERYTG